MADYTKAKTKQYLKATAIQIDVSKNPTQKAFLECQARYQCFSGGFGAGKTWAACVKGAILSAIMPGNLGVIARRTYPDLRDSTMRSFFEVVPEDWYTFKQAEHRVIFKNGSEVLFRHFDNGKIKVGANIGWFFLDQAEEASEEVFLGLVGRLRRRDKNVVKNYGMLAMNPNGKDWQYKRFVATQDPNYAIFNVNSHENTHNLPPNYIEDMLASYPKEWIERFIEGLWTDFSGRIFHEFDTAAHVVAPFKIPTDWPVVRGMDWGVDAPATCVWIAKSPDGTYYEFQEYGANERTPDEHAATILEQSKMYQPARGTVLDSSAYNRESDLKSIANQFINAGVKPLFPGTKDTLARILLVKRLLKSGKLKTFNTCTDLIHEKQTWKWGARRSGKEVPANGNDHFLDAEGYALYWMERKQFGIVSEPEQRTERTFSGRLSIGQQTEENLCDPVTGFPLIS